MAKAKIDSDTLKIMALFELVTGARLKDCITNDKIFFVVHPNQSGIAIGKNGSNIKKIERLLNRKCIVKEYSRSMIEFIKNLIEPVKIEGIKEVDGIVEVKCSSNEERSTLIGRDRRNISLIEGIARRHFELKKMRVV